jgi:hypothetical protein
MVLGLIVLSGASATSQEWSEQSQNKAHVASGEHGFFSVRNRAERRYVSHAPDVAAARDQGWWGTSVTVSVDQIQQN